jgi:hypothetical protein
MNATGGSTDEKRNNDMARGGKTGHCAGPKPSPDTANCENRISILYRTTYQDQHPPLAIAPEAWSSLPSGPSIYSAGAQKITGCALASRITNTLRRRDSRLLQYQRQPTATQTFSIMVSPSAAPSKPKPAAVLKPRKDPIEKRLHEVAKELQEELSPSEVDTLREQVIAAALQQVTKRTIAEFKLAQHLKQAERYKALAGATN